MMWGQSDFRNLYIKLRQNKLFKDSFWAIFGNGMGNALLLFAGILIARLLGRDLYGEYGVVKTNMFYMAGFSTFGLVYSSTRYIAKFLINDKTRVINIIRVATKITLIFSGAVAIIIAFSANLLEEFLETPGISEVFRALSIIIVFKALASTGNGILAGLGKFSSIARSNVISGLCMFIACIPLTYYLGLKGALLSLALSQFINLIINYWYIYRESKLLPIYYKNETGTSELLRFSFPIALQEISYALCNWVGILMLTKFSSVSEVALFSASSQWNAVIMMIPGLMANVVLSHLSATDGQQQHRLVYRLLAVYFVCTIIPLLIVFGLSDFIVMLYGNEFSMMKPVLLMSVLSTIPICCSDVFKAELIAVGKTWTLFGLRMMKDLILVSAAGYFLISRDGENGAFYYALSLFFGAVLFLCAVFIAYRRIIRHNEANYKKTKI